MTKHLRTVKANAGIEADYRRRMIRLIEEMSNSVVHWISRTYRASPPAMLAQDDLSANDLRRELNRLIRQWQTRFDAMAPRMAEHFAQAANKRSEASLKKIFRDGGLTIGKFRPTRAQRDVLKAAIHENVSLIKSIPERYFTQVETLVYQSVARGGRLDQLAKDLQKQYGVTKRRAALIARDQNHKVTSALTHSRYDSVGISEAIWVHSSAGHEPRPTHVKAGRDKVRYNVREGWYDPAVKQKIFPGQLINCRCQSTPVVVGFNA